MTKSDTNPTRIQLDVQGLGVCVLDNITVGDERRLRSYLVAPHRVSASACVDTLISAALVSPQLTPREVGTLSKTKRRRLRIAALEVVGAAPDYRRLGGSHLTADERAVAALVWRRERGGGIGDALRRRLQQRAKELAEGTVKMPAVKPITGTSIRPVWDYGVRPNVIAQLAGGLGASPLANLGVRPEMFKGISLAADISKRIGGLDSFASSKSVLSDSLLKATSVGADFNVLKRQVQGIGSVYPVRSKPYVSPLSALARDYFDRPPLSALGVLAGSYVDRPSLGTLGALSGNYVSPLGALADQFAKSLPSNILQAQMRGIMPIVEPSLGAAGLSLAAALGPDTERLSKNIADALRVSAPPSLFMDASRLSVLAQFGVGDIVQGTGEFAEFEEPYDDGMEGQGIVTPEDEAFWLVALLTAIRAQGVNVARTAQQTGGRALDAAGEWMWQYPLSPLADYHDLAMNLEPHERAAIRTSRNSAGLALGGVVLQTFTVPFSVSWTYNLLVAWVTLNDFYNQLDALKQQQQRSE